MTNDPTGRVLQLLSLLQTHRMWSGTELADRLEVSARTLRRDIDRLRALGYPVEAAPGVSGGYRLAAGTHLPPLVLDDDEAVAIAVGLRAAAGAAIEGMEDTSVRALAKLEQVLPDRLRRRVSAVHASIATLRWTGAPGPTVDPDAMGVLAQACRDHEEVRFDYERRDGEKARRLVEPHQLVSAGRRWYLAAWDRRRDDWRTFRLDRLSDARLAGSRFEPRSLPDGDAATYVARSIASMPRAFETTMLVGASAEHIDGVLRWAEADVEQTTSASCRVRLRGDSVDRLVSTISAIALTADVRVEGPPEVAAATAALARRLAVTDVGVR